MHIIVLNVYLIGYKIWIYNKSICLLYALYKTKIIISKKNNNKIIVKVHYFI